MTVREIIELILWLRNDFDRIDYTGANGPKYTAYDKYDNAKSGVSEAEAVENLWRSLQ